MLPGRDGVRDEDVRRPKVLESCLGEEVSSSWGEGRTVLLIFIKAIKPA